MPQTTDRYPVRVLIAVDQLGNAISGGSPRHTVSARAGFWSYKGRPLWRMLEFVINVAMAPWQCKWNHCLEAWEDEMHLAPGYDFLGGSGPGTVLVSVFILIAAPVIGLAGLPYYAFNRGPS